MNVYLKSRALDQEAHYKILQQFKERNLTFKSLAIRLEVSPSAVSMVSTGRAVSQKITDEIARTLDTNPAALWPHRYQETDNDIV